MIASHHRGLINESNPRSKLQEQAGERATRWQHTRIAELGIQLTRENQRYDGWMDREEAWLGRALLFSTHWSQQRNEWSQKWAKWNFWQLRRSLCAVWPPICSNLSRQFHLSSIRLLWAANGHTMSRSRASERSNGTHKTWHNITKLNGLRFFKWASVPNSTCAKTNWETGAWEWVWEPERN